MDKSRHPATTVNGISDILKCTLYCVRTWYTITILPSPVEVKSPSCLPSPLPPLPASVFLRRLSMLDVTICVCHIPCILKVLSSSSCVPVNGPKQIVRLRQYTREVTAPQILCGKYANCANILGRLLLPKYYAVNMQITMW
jgi:hypothetical protein